MDNQSYFDTTRLDFQELLEAIKQAERQDDQVLTFFSHYYHREFSPSDVWAIIFVKQHVPLTSVRRSLSNLTHRGALVKLKRKKMGVYGRQEHLWRFNPDYRKGGLKK